MVIEDWAFTSCISIAMSFTTINMSSIKFKEIPGSFGGSHAAFFWFVCLVIFCHGFGVKIQNKGQGVDPFLPAGAFHPTPFHDVISKRLPPMSLVHTLWDDPLCHEVNLAYSFYHHVRQPFSKPKTHAPW